MKKVSVRTLCTCAIVAAMYAAITILSTPFAYGPIQFRIGEALVVLCAFSPKLGIGITLGCLLANINSPTPWDMLFGTLATAIACLLTARCKKAWLAILPNIVVNAVIIGAMLAYTLMKENWLSGFAIFGAEVALGEIAVMVLLGIPLFSFAKRTGFVTKIMEP